MTTWALTGGAGYIGAHVLHALRAAGHGVVVVDDLSTGEKRKVPDDVALAEVSVLDRDGVATVLRDHAVDGVVHLAAKKAVNESVERPLHYYRENVDGLLSLVEAMDDAGVGRFVFSSSAAVYGTPDTELVTETSPTVPESPYGETKLAGEWVTRAVGRARGLSWTSLRYFNVAGAGAPGLGDTGVFNLVPLVLRALTEGRRPQVFGDDYPTPDGTCVRDYIHVADLADAHVDAVAHVESGRRDDVFNVGTGRGFSVREVVEAIGRATGLDATPEVVGRRAGDPPRVVAAPDLIRERLGWSATRDLDDIARSAWEAWQAFPPS